MLNYIKKKRWIKILLFMLIMTIAVIPAYKFAAAGTVSQKTLLKNTISFCDKLTQSEYTSASWKAFQKELTNAKTVYKKKSQKDSVYGAERDKLEMVKANLMFVPSKDKGNPVQLRVLSADRMVEEMGAGWNLGNTMDGHSDYTPNELTWQSVKTTKTFIKAVHDAGYNTIRIPVTWGKMIDDNNDFKIDDTWISRVQDIVDYCISQDMYVILNVHHDGVGWLNVAAGDIDSIYNKYEHLWRNIAERFKDYDEHLIFESMNEVGSATQTPEKDTEVIMNLNQVFVNVVRSIGSNNAQRWLCCPGRYTNIDVTVNLFKLPKDTVKNRIFLSVHQYDFGFGLVEDMAGHTFGKNSANSLVATLQKLIDNFTSKGVPVIIGEFGAANKKNTEDRAYYYELLSRVSQNGGMVACAWDGGGYDFSKSPSDYTMSLFDRNTGKIIFPELVYGVMRGTYLPAKTADYSDIVKSPKIFEITKITLSTASLSMSINENKDITATVSPDNSNDVVLWKTTDPTVATVSNGHVRARGIGTTVLTAFSQSGSAQTEVTVTVNAKASKNPCTGITTDNDSYSVSLGGYVNIKTGLSPAATDDFVTYRSSDEGVATVNYLGKVVGCSIGTADIIITASNGLTKTVKVTVTKKEVKVNKDLCVALNIFYNDAVNKYYSNETGKPVDITGNGQYTVSFDCTKELSSAAKKAGVTSLFNMGAIYIKDYNVTMNKAKKSPLVSCDIRYDKILVDGKELTITQTKPKSAIKATGIFDTNDPFNAYDGSAVKEATAKKYVLNIDGFTNPKKVEVTFTISNLVFEGEQ